MRDEVAKNLKHLQIMKKLKLFFVAMLLSAAAINSSGQSVGEKVKHDGITYLYRSVTEGNRYVCIVGADATVTGDVIIPATIKDKDNKYEYRVLEIACSFGSNDINSLTFPEGFLRVFAYGTGIGNSISGSRIKVINIPSTVTNIAVGGQSQGLGSLPALTAINVDPNNNYYSSVDGVLFNKDKTTLLYYPYGKTATSYTVPEGVTTIYTAAITNSNLTSLTFASTTTTVNSGSSIGCPNLTDISIPAAMTTLPSLTSCTKLQNYWVAEGNPNYSDIGGVLCNADKSRLVSYPLGRTETEYIIPSSIKVIGASAFNGNKVLETIDFEGSQVETIGNTAFKNCSALTTVINLPTTLKAINFEAFSGCSKLASCSLPNSVETIGANAFYDCSKLDPRPLPNSLKTIGEKAFLYTKISGELVLPESLVSIGNNAFGSTKVSSITIPANVTSIGSNIFNGVTSLENIYVAEGNEYFKDIDGVLFNEEGTRLLLYPAGRVDTEYTIPEGTQVISNNAMGNTHLTTVNFPASVTTLNNYALSGCNKITTLNIPDDSQMKTIGSFALSGLSSLTSFNLPVSVVSLGDRTFYGVPLTSFTIPDNSKLRVLNSGCLGNMSKLKDVYIGENTQLQEIRDFCTAGYGYTYYWSHVENITIARGNTQLKSIGGGSMPPSLKSLIIAEDAGSASGITIQDAAFQNATKLTHVELPAAVISLGNMAFANLTNLKSVVIGDSEEHPCRLATIGQNVFKNCGIESFTVPSSVKTIAYEAFCECPVLTTVDIPAGCNSVHFQAFEACPNLTAINVDKGNPKYSSSDGIFLNKMKTELIIYPAGKTEEHFTLLPPSVTTIGEMSFFKNPKLKNVMIPKHVTEIKKNAFLTCENLKNIVLLGDDPTAITIGDQAFENVPADAKIWLRYDQQGSGIAEWNGFTNFDYCKMGADDDTNHQYEFFVMDNGSANVLSVKNNATDHTLVMPATISDGTNEYNVDYLGDFMLEDAQANIKEVVVKHTPKYIGANAFGNADAFLCDDVDDMSTIRFEYDKALFNGQYNEGKNIYMKKSVAEACLADDKWADLADVIEYHVPLPAISTDYGTFSREFAVDLDAINPDKTKPQVIAFTAGNPHYDASKNLTTVTMVSINHTGSSLEGSSGDGDGTYIPANTGVLLKAYNGSSTAYDKTSEAEDKGAYYQIAENQTESYSGENQMANVTVHSRTIQPVEDGMRNFYVAQGKLWSFSAPRTSTVHKSYLQLPEEVSPSGAKLAIVFVNPDSNESTTGISAAELAEETDGSAVYNLQGQRVGKAVKGFYIKNGKKYLVK